MPAQAITFLASLVAIWIGSGLIVSSVNRFAARLRISAFALSFSVLGIMTSIPEFSVGMNSFLEGRPDIFIGNLIGASAVIFFLVIPLVAIFGNGVKLNGGFAPPQLALSLAVILAPALLSADGRLTSVEGIIMLMLYTLLSLVLPSSQTFFSRIKEQVGLRLFSKHWVDFSRLSLGVAIVFVASHFIVESTVGLASRWHIPAILISMFALSVGTNVPELALGARSVMTGKKDIAFGDYVGSAAANTLLFGFFLVLTGQEILLYPGIWMTSLLVAVGYSLFWFLAQSHKFLSRREGVIMLLLYVAFLLIQFYS